MSADDGDLPEGWAVTTLDSAGTWQTGGTPSRKTPSYFGGTIPWVKSGDLKDGLIERTEERITQEGLNNSAARILPNGTLSIALYGATIGKLGILDFKAATNQACANCIVDEEITQNWFLFYYVLSQRQQLIEAGQGGAQPNLTNALVRDWPLPLPPLAEQKRIVAKVEEALGQVTAARERLARVPTILKRFRQSVLAAACSGRLTEDWRRKNKAGSARQILDQIKKSSAGAKTRRGVPESVDLPEMLAGLELPENWELVSVAELLHGGILLDVKDGNHGANHPKVSDFSASGLPFITAAQVNDFKIDYETAYKVSGPALERLRVGFAKPGDAVLTHKGSVGRSAMNVRDCILTPQTTYYRCHPDALDSRYLVYFFASTQCYVQLAHVMSQTTRDFVPISEQYLLYLVVPPLAEQREIVRRVEALFARADEIEARLTAATQRVERLTQAVLAKAFRGELVPTEAELARREGRDYEPASVLLERVRAEREQPNASTRHNGKRRARRTC